MGISVADRQYGGAVQQLELIEERRRLLRHGSLDRGDLEARIDTVAPAAATTGRQCVHAWKISFKRVNRPPPPPLCPARLPARRPSGTGRCSLPAGYGTN